MSVMLTEILAFNLFIRINSKNNMKYLRNIVSVLILLLVPFACNKKTDAFLKIDSTKRDLVFDSNGGSIRVPVNSNYDFTVEVLGNVSWCQATTMGQSVVVTVDELIGINREAFLKVESKNCSPISISVKQVAITVVNAPEVFELTNASLDFSIDIISGVEVIFEYDSWIKPIDIEWSKGIKKYSFKATAFLDSNKDNRTGSLIIKSKDSSVGYSLTIPINQSNYTNAAIKELNDLYKTDVFDFGSLSNINTRYQLLANIEEKSNNLGPNDFKNYLSYNEVKAVETEKNTPILSMYRYAYDKVMSEVSNTTVEQGSTIIWLLYNMGIIVKTPSVCFGIDINHRLAKDMEPILDFLAVTHAHNDHKDDELNARMVAANKPVISNFYSGSPKYMSKSSSSFDIKGVNIRMCMGDHDNNLKNYTSSFRIKCGAESGHFDILHCGDNAYNVDQLQYVLGGEPSIVVLRYGNPAEKNILGTSNTKVNPKYLLFSHLIELRHNIGSSPARATIQGAIGNIHKHMTYPSTKVLPFWGEKLIWKNDELFDGDN